MVEQCGKFGIKRMAITLFQYTEGKTLAVHTLEIARKYGFADRTVSMVNTDNGLCLPFIPIHKVSRGEMSIISQAEEL